MNFQTVITDLKIHVRQAVLSVTVIIITISEDLCKFFYTHGQGQPDVICKKRRNKKKLQTKFLKKGYLRNF